MEDVEASAGYRQWLLSRVGNTLGREWVFVGAVICGSLLRAYQLSDQILVDDEWHALNAVIYMDAWEILTTFGDSHISAPMALYFKFFMNKWGLSEVAIRAPFLLVGVATLVIFPLAARRFVGRFAADLFAWLLAISPALVLFSRFARPYGISLLLAMAAVYLFRAWWIAAVVRLGVLYVLLAGLAVWLLPVMLPFVLGPFVFFLTFAFRGGRATRSVLVRRLVSLGVVTAMVLAVVLGSALRRDVGSLVEKTRQQSVSVETAASALGVLVGSAGPVLGACMVALGAVGFLGFFRRGSFLTYLGVLALLQVAAVLAAGPLGGGSPFIVARYMLPVGPILLLFAAAGAARLAKWSGSHARWAGPAMATGLVCASLLKGPLPAQAFYPNQWMSQQILVSASFGAEEYNRSVQRTPEFYRTLARLRPGSIRIVEASSNAFDLWVALAHYQRLHRQHTLIGFHNGLCGSMHWGEYPMGDSRFRFRNYVFLADPASLMDRGVHYVIFHKWLEGEGLARRYPLFEQDLSVCISEYRRRVGEPVFEDRDVLVFKLETQ